MSTRFFKETDNSFIHVVDNRGVGGANHEYKVIDLFCGCGGLSAGLKNAGFDLSLAVEKSEMAAETFYHNFIKRIKKQEEWEKFVNSKSMLEQASEKLIVGDIQEVVQSKELLNQLKNEKIDLIAGGPPCQGFSLAGRRNPNDKRNKLPWHFLSLVEALKPKAVLMENVAGIQSKFKDSSKDAPLEQIKMALKGLGYAVQPVLLNAIYYGVPQFRPRVMLIAIREEIAQVLNLKIEEEIWKSEYALKSDIYQYPSLAPKITHKGNQILTVEDAFNNIPENVKNNVERNHSENVINRFRLYQYFQRNNISIKVFNFVAKNNMEGKKERAELKELLKNAEFPAKSPDGYLLAKNIKQLMSLTIELATKKHSQRPLILNMPSPTVVTLPDDYVHPTKPRTLTVREMATLQSFPFDFEFRAKETTGGTKRRTEVPQYSQVGNAVPPLLAKAVGEKILSILKEFDNIELEKEEK